MSNRAFVFADVGAHQWRVNRDDVTLMDSERLCSGYRPKRVEENNPINYRLLLQASHQDLRRKLSLKSFGDRNHSNLLMEHSIDLHNATTPYFDLPIMLSDLSKKLKQTKIIYTR